MTEEEIIELSKEISKNMIKIMEMPGFIWGEEIEPIKNGIEKVIKQVGLEQSS